MVLSPSDMPAPKVHVVYLNYWYEPEMGSFDDLLETYVTMARWVEALRIEGAEVAVFQRYRRSARIERNGVEFVLHEDRYAPHLRKWQVPRSFHRRIQQWTAERSSRREPTVVHCNGMHFPVQLRALRTTLPARSAIVVQHHADQSAQGLRQILQRWGLGAADGFFFAAAELASAWVAAGTIRINQSVYQIMEGSTSFRWQDRRAARARTGFCGDPTLLWVGRLIALKDPLTVLRGFEAILHTRPNARLYMVYGTDDLLPEVRAYIAESRLLAGSVALLGRRPHDELESIYNSADYFVLGSHSEGSGYALAEALACGVVPVVTDIPAFRVMTGEGTIGACWPPGDSAAFAAVFDRVAAAPLQIHADRAMRIFEEHLSYPAIARSAIAAYRELAGKRMERGS